MNGPQHYAEAERFLAAVSRTLETAQSDDDVHVDAISSGLAAAQVHATLALTAATIETRVIGPQQGWGGHLNEVPTASGWVEATHGESHPANHTRSTP